MSEEKKEMKKSSSPAKDLTVGSPMKLILGFAFPMFLVKITNENTQLIPETGVRLKY